MLKKSHAIIFLGSARAYFLGERPGIVQRRAGAGLDFARPRSRTEATRPFPLVGVMRVADAHGNGAGVNVAVIDVPAILAVGRAAAGKG
jgi:hypothetical protein